MLPNTDILLVGKVLPIGANWGLTDAKGEFVVNTYYQFRTDDDVDIFVHTRGVPSSSREYTQTHVTLETGDPKYYWVNNLLLVATANITIPGNSSIEAWAVKVPN